jgi:hypothetical protein
MKITTHEKVTLTKKGYYALALLLIGTGVLLDSSGNAVSQTLHHVAFIMSGISIGFGIRR